MIFEIEDIPEGGLNLDLLAAKEQFEINQPDCSLSEDIKLRGRLAKIEQDINFSGELQAILQVACTRCLNLFVYNIETDSNEQRPIVSSEELPERALIILGIIFGVVAIAGLKFRKRTTEVEVQHL